MSEAHIADDLEAEWKAIDALCTAFSAREWERPTDCPGWSVKDQVAHMSGSESAFLRSHDVFGSIASAREVRQRITAFNDRVIGKRRGWSGERVLNEFRHVTARRVAALRAMTEEETSVAVMSPIGRIPYREFLRIRLFDCWVHEQDIRHAVGGPMSLEGPLHAQALEQIAAGVPFVLARRANLPDGATVVFQVDGGRVLPLAFHGGRGRQFEAAPADPTVRIVTDGETFVRLACGRLRPEDADVQIEGDDGVGRSALAGMNILF